MSDERPALAFELRTEGDPAALAASYMKHTDTLESDGEISESGDVPHAAAAASAASAVAPVVAEAVAAQAGAEDGGGEAAQMDAAGSDNELPVQDDSVHMHAEAESPDAEVASNVSFCDTSSDSSSSSDEDDGESGAKARPARERPVVADDEDEEIGEADMRTKNEIAKLPPVEPLSIEVPAGAVVSQIGAVSGVVDTLVIVKAMIGGEIEVLDQDSILLLEDRTPLGRVFDTFGPVSVPFYSVRFNSASEIKEKQIAVGMPVFFTKDLVKFVFTQPLRRIKGSDASNLYDEEVAEDQMEFSDDEQEAAFRRELKEKRKRKAGGQADRNRSGSDDDEGDEDGRSRGGRSIRGRGADRGRGGGGGRGSRGDGRPHQPHDHAARRPAHHHDPRHMHPPAAGPVYGQHHHPHHIPLQPPLPHQPPPSAQHPPTTPPGHHHSYQQPMQPINPFGQVAPFPPAPFPPAPMRPGSFGQPPFAPAPYAQPLFGQIPSAAAHNTANAPNMAAMLHQLQQAAQIQLLQQQQQSQQQQQRILGHPAASPRASQTPPRAHALAPHSMPPQQGSPAGHLPQRAHMPQAQQQQQQQQSAPASGQIPFHLLPNPFEMDLQAAERQKMQRAQTQPPAQPPASSLLAALQQRNPGLSGTQPPSES